MSSHNSGGWCWANNASWCYATNSRYLWLESNDVLISYSHWSWLWIILDPEKVKFLFWRSALNYLPTNSLRFRRKISTTPICGRCNTTIEDLSTPSEIAGTQLFFGVV
ncbi:putative reverse transcriptase zinc-binding domain-containing protein [Lupinus albus]|uniref:Putative reverse transcriptase zinc-binding domain-containing protein n=1 Tax=Lupinus albus TaxID=3870 RepID=A0A6A4PNS2_LUPAL|nr:putative reverse transcriptase zinc-binding domain-containing protein [Lupinus albus]